MPSCRPLPLDHRPLTAIVTGPPFKIFLACRKDTTVPPPALLPSESVPHVSPRRVTLTVPPLTTKAVSLADGTVPPQFKAADQSPEETCQVRVAPRASAAPRIAAIARKATLAQRATIFTFHPFARAAVFAAIPRRKGWINPSLNYPTFRSIDLRYRMGRIL